MGKLINRFNEELHKDSGTTSTVLMPDMELADTDKNDYLERFRLCQKEKGVFEVSFSYADTEGNLYATDENGVRIVFKKDEILKGMSYYNAYHKDSYLGTSFLVKISDIGVDGVVYVTSAQSNRNTTKSRIMSEIFKELKKGNQPVVAGKVIDVTPKRATVNILCQGILGIVNVENWQKGYIRYLTEAVKAGDIIDCAVVGQRERIKGKDIAFNLSREPLTKDPWETLPKSLEEGGVITVKCIDKPNGKWFWWGKSASAPGIEIMCDFNNNLGPIMVSGVYKCKIDRIDPKKHVLKVIPFAVSSTNKGFEDAVRFIHTAVVK